MIRLRPILVLWALVTPVASAAQTAPAQTPPPIRLTLADAIGRASTSNKALIAARLRTAVDVAGTAVALERPNPEFTYEAAKETPHQSFGFSLPIETAGKRARRLDLARATADVTAATIAQTTLDVTTDVRRAYFTLAAANARATIAAEMRDLASRASETAAARVAAGDAPRLEQLQAELELAAADNDLTRSRAEVRSARAGLGTLIGVSPDTPIETLDDVMIAPPAALAAGGATTLTDALTHSVDLAVLDREILQQQARRNLAQAESRPDFSAGAALTYDAPGEFRYGWRVSGGVTLPIFTQHKAGVVLEDATLVAIRAERDALVTEITGQVADLAARASAAADALARFTGDILPRSRQIEAMAEDSYRSGESGLVALLQTVQSARSLRLQSVQAGLDLQLALADLERATGAAIR